MRPTVYIETSIVSYPTARTTEDTVRTAHQRVTRQWWDGRKAFDLYVSQFVWDKAAAGNVEAAARRLAVREELGLLDITEDPTRPAEDLLVHGGLPTGARIDAFHVAIATIHGMDY